MCKRFWMAALILTVLLAACAPAAVPAAPTAPKTIEKIQVALGFVPSVQSSPFYVAQDKGYYAAEGLEVELKYGQIQNLLKQVSDGALQAQWPQAEPLRGFSFNPQGDLLVLRQRSIAVLRSPSGRAAEEWPLPAPTQGLSVPYRTVLGRRNGEILVSDFNTGQVRRFSAAHVELPSVGKLATWPGQFAGPGGWPGELTEPRGLAEDQQGRLYVSDGSLSRHPAF